MATGFDASPAESVIAAVAEVTGQSPLEMEPLAEVIDPDALDSLFDSTDDRSASTTVTFGYCGLQVTMTADSVQVDPSDPAVE